MKKRVNRRFPEATSTIHLSTPAAFFTPVPPHSPNVTLCLHRRFVKFAQNSAPKIAIDFLFCSLTLYDRMFFFIFSKEIYVFDFCFSYVPISHLHIHVSSQVCWKSSSSCAGSFSQQTPNRPLLLLCSWRKENFAFPRLDTLLPVHTCYALTCQINNRGKKSNAYVSRICLV